MKKYLPYILIVFLGVGTSLFAYAKLSAETGEPIETIQIVVPAHDILPFQEIKPSDLKMKTIPISKDSENMVTDPQTLVGKRFETTLFSDWEINKKLIKEENQLKEKHIVTINVDPARSARAQAGDIVDVYLVRPLTLEWGDEGVRWGEKIISKVIVLSIQDGLATLAVDEDLTYKLVNAATSDSEYYVLAIRQQITEKTPYIGDAEENKV